MEQLTPEKQKELLEKVKNIITFDLILAGLKKDFRDSLNKKYPSEKVIGIFGMNNAMIKTSDNGDMLSSEMIKKLSNDLSKDFIVITQFGIQDNGNMSTIETTELWNNLSGRESQSIDYSECLSSVVRNSIFILNEDKNSSVLHEIRGFHKNNFSDNLLCIGFLFSYDMPTCKKIKKLQDSVFCCESDKIEECVENEKDCIFSKHLTISNCGLFINNKDSFLFTIKAYNDIERIFKEKYGILVKKS